MALAATQSKQMVGGVVRQFLTDTAITMNGATAVTSSLTFATAFSAAPKICGTFVQDANSTPKTASVIVSAVSASAITLSVFGLSGNTNANVVIGVEIEGTF